MRSLTQREADEICAKHELFLKGQPGGEFADFSDCDLSQLNFVGKRLTGANFEGAKLDACNLDRAEVNECNFSYASMNGVYMHETHAVECNFFNAVMSGAKLDNVICFNSDFSMADLSGSSMFAVNLTDCNMDHAVLDNSHLTAMNAARANFKSASLKSCDITGQANLSFANLDSANLMESNLQKADLSGANLVDCNLRNTELLMSNMSFADVGGTNLAEAFHADTVNMNGIRNFDVDAFKMAQERPQNTLTPVQTLQMPVYNAYLQKETSNQIDRGQFFNPMAQETYFAGRDNPLLAANSYMLGSGTAQEAKIVSLDNNLLNAQTVKDPMLGKDTAQAVPGTNVYKKYDNSVSNNPILGKAQSPQVKEESGKRIISASDLRVAKAEKDVRDAAAAKQEPQGRNAKMPDGRE